MNEYYELKGFANSRYLSNNPILLSRLQNRLVSAITQETLLPKAIIVVVDDDIIRDLEYEGSEVYAAYLEQLEMAHERIRQNSVGT